tara:strand:- start:776 stop:1249 length:474 start_codon:yes stop_codon:yes gene_type:complete
MDIYKLHKKKRARERERLEHFKNILKRCHRRIKIVSDKMETSCYFVIPEIVFGIPLYNNTECANFLVESLRNNGFIVNYIHPNLLYISWEVIPENHLPKHKRSFKQIENNKDDQVRRKRIKDRKKYRQITDICKNNSMYKPELLEKMQKKSDFIMDL